MCNAHDRRPRLAEFQSGRVLAVLACMLAIFALPAASPGQIGSGEYKNTQHAFRIKPYPRWTRLKEGPLAQAQAESASAKGAPIWPFVAAWTKGDVGRLIVPHVIIECSEHDMTGMTLADIERAFDAETPSGPEPLFSASIEQLFKKLPLNQELFDRSHKRLLRLQSRQIDGIGEVRDLFISHITSRGVVALVFATDAKLIDEYGSEFQGFYDSFAIEPQAVYSEPNRSLDKGQWTSGRGARNKSSGSGGTAGGAGGKEKPQFVMPMALGGGGLVAIVLVVIAVARRG